MRIRPTRVRPTRVRPTRVRQWADTHSADAFCDARLANAVTGDPDAQEPDAGEPDAGEESEPELPEPSPPEPLSPEPSPPEPLRWQTMFQWVHDHFITKTSLVQLIKAFDDPDIKVVREKNTTKLQLQNKIVEYLIAAQWRVLSLASLTQPQLSAEQTAELLRTYDASVAQRQQQE